jgi:hypothetical protein
MDKDRIAAIPFDIDHGARELPPRQQINGQQNGTGYVWHGGTCELIPILWPDHPDYRENRERLLEAFRRWNRGTMTPTAR